MSKLIKITKAIAFLVLLGISFWGIRYATAPAYDGNAGIAYGIPPHPVAAALRLAATVFSMGRLQGATHHIRRESSP